MKRAGLSWMWDRGRGWLGGRVEGGGTAGCLGGSVAGWLYGRVVLWLSDHVGGVLCDGASGCMGDWASGQRGCTERGRKRGGQWGVMPPMYCASPRNITMCWDGVGLGWVVMCRDGRGRAGMGCGVQGSVVRGGEWAVLGVWGWSGLGWDGLGWAGQGWVVMDCTGRGGVGVGRDGVDRMGARVAGRVAGWATRDAPSAPSHTRSPQHQLPDTVYYE